MLGFRGREACVIIDESPPLLYSDILLWLPVNVSFPDRRCRSGGGGEDSKVRLYVSDKEHEADFMLYF